jgi:hypothetical protein
MSSFEVSMVEHDDGKRIGADQFKDMLADEIA